MALVGRGATDVESAAELVSLAEGAAAYGALGEATKFCIVLIEAGSCLRPRFPEASSEAVHVLLQMLGVSVVVGGRVSCASRATEQGFEAGWHA